MSGGHSLFLGLLFAWEDFSCNAVMDVSNSRRMYSAHYHLAHMGPTISMKASINIVIRVLIQDKPWYLLIFDVFW